MYITNYRFTTNTLANVTCPLVLVKIMLKPLPPFMGGQSELAIFFRFFWQFFSGFHFASFACVWHPIRVENRGPKMEPYNRLWLDYYICGWKWVWSTQRPLCWCCCCCCYCCCGCNVCRGPGLKRKKAGGGLGGRAQRLPPSALVGKQKAPREEAQKRTSRNSL